MTPHLTPECRLVFLTAGPAPDAERLVALAGEAGNWARVVVIAERERAVSTLWRALAPARASVPAEAAQHLHRSSMVTAFRMDYLRERLQATLAALHAADVPVMLLKGAALGASVYPTPRDRPMLDVDLLIRPADAERAQRVVLESGWRERGDPVVVKLLEGHHHLPPFLDVQNTGVRLEVHTSLLPVGNPFALTDAELWASAQPAPPDFAGALVPDPHHMLWHACVHFAWSHAMQFGAWRTFRDASQLISRGLINWESFVALAMRTRAASACFWTLRLAARMAEVPVPEQALRMLEPPGSRVFKRALERNFIADIALGEGPQCPSVTLSHALWRMAIRPRWSGHEARDRFGAGSHWEEELHGVRPDPPSGRIVRHLTGAGNWWRYVRQTLMAS